MREARPDTELLCPSATCQEGSVLLGIVGRDGVVGYVRPKLYVDAGFVEEARKGRKPESRFRFAAPCVEAQCGYWTGHECGLIGKLDQLASEQLEPDIGDSLPACSIRASCRWFSQRGAAACRVCPFVVTEPNSPESVARRGGETTTKEQPPLPSIG